jgi:hypothetical protein
MILCGDESSGGGACSERSVDVDNPWAAWIEAY